MSKSLADKITDLVDHERKRAVATHGFVVPGDKTMIDVVDPNTGLSCCFGQTLDEVRQRYPGAVVMSIDEFCKAKAAEQDSPVEWLPSTAERYEEMLNVLPPAAHIGYAFLVGEPWDHHALTGEPRYEAWRRGKSGQYFVSNRPMTKREFRAIFASSCVR